MSTLTFDKPDILPIVSQYVTLRKTGKNYSGLCPLHSEKTPSFTLNSDRQRFKCFGCGESGDVLNFVQQVNGCDFKGALSILGISKDQPYRPDPVQIRKRELERQFRAWCNQHFNVLAAEYRLLNKALDALHNLDDMAALYKRRTILEYHIDILSGKDDAEKLALYQVVKYG